MKKITAALVIAAVVVSACVEPIVMDPLEEMPVVVNCVLTRNHWGDDEEHYESMGYEKPVQRLSLYYAKRPSEKEYMPISDASVQVSGGGKTYMFSWDGRYWTASFLPEFGVKYDLRVLLADGKKLTAQTEYPPHIYISQIPLVSYIPLRESWAVWSYVSEAQVRYNSAQGRYETVSSVYDGEAYLWVTAKVDSTIVPIVTANFKDSTTIVLSTSHPYADNFNLSQVGVWEDMPYTMRRKEEFFNIRYKVEEKGELVEYAPDPEIWKNFENAGRGQPLHPFFIRIHHPSHFDSGLRGTFFYPETKKAEPKDLFILDSFSLTEDDSPFYLINEYVAVAVSEEYDRYLRELIEYKEMNIDDFVMIYSTKKIYSNIEGGLGIFGAKF